MKLKSNILETKFTCCLWYDLSNFKVKLDFWPQLHGPLNIENESGSLRLKFLVKVVFDEVEVQSTWNLVHMILWYDLSNFNAKLDLLPNFTVNWTWKMIVRLGHPCTLDTFLFSWELKKMLFDCLYPKYTWHICYWT